MWSSSCRLVQHQYIGPLSSLMTHARTSLFLFIVFCLMKCSAGPRRVSESVAGEISIRDTILYDCPHFKIVTATATYLLDRPSGGFSSILDEEGNDWVAYRPVLKTSVPGSAANAFRGLPNMVFLPGDDEGAGHPGFAATQSVRKVAENRIRCVSNSGKFIWEYTFYPEYLRMKQLSTDPAVPHWVLYEGPVGGTFRPETAYWGTPDSLSYRTPDLMDGGPELLNAPWFYFGDVNIPRVFFAAQRRADNHPDLMAFMGNGAQGLDSPDGMIVFGFGRNDDTQPQMKEPNTYYFGFFTGNLRDNEQSRVELSRFIEQLRTER